MIESTISKKNTNDNSIFPLIAESKTSSLVVLFDDNQSGTVIVESDKYQVGHHCENWVSCFDKEDWDILSSGTSITLTVI